MLTILVIFAVASRCLVVEGVEGCIGKCPQTTENGIINYLPHNDCNKYCVCVAGQPEVMPCKFDEHWSPELEICTHPAEARCQSKNVDLGCVSNCPNYAVLIGHHFCSKYCECQNSEATVRDCPSGLLFSTEKQTCVEREDSDCPLEPPTQPPTPPPTQPPTRPPTEPPTRPPTEPPTRPPITPPPTDTTGCIGKCPLCNLPDKTHQLPHKDPTKFCKCNWGKPVVFQCPDDLIYNEKEEVCDYPYGAAGCPDSKSKNEP